LNKGKIWPFVRTSLLLLLLGGVAWGDAEKVSVFSGKLVNSDVEGVL
jgi:hypothetical protein